MFGANWEPATATIVAKKVKNGSVESGSTYEYVADVRPDSGAAPFRTVLHEPMLHNSFRSPSEGATVKVEANVKKEKAKFDLSDPNLSSTRAFDDEKNNFEAAKSGPVGTPLHATDPLHSEDPRLQKLADLHTAGALTDTEYAEQKAKLLDQT